MKPLKVLIADNHILFQRGLQIIFNRAVNIEVVGTLNTWQDLMEKIDSLKPDLILLDPNLPGLEEWGELKQLLKKNPGLKVLALTLHKEDPKIRHALKSGVHGFLLKSTEPGQLIDNIWHAAKKSQKKTGNGRLTKREVEILLHVAEGRTNKTIARELCISEKTVKNHVSSILKKLEVVDRTQAVVKAVKEGLVVL